MTILRQRELNNLPVIPWVVTKKVVWGFELRSAQFQSPHCVTTHGFNLQFRIKWCEIGTALENQDLKE